MMSDDFGSFQFGLCHAMYGEGSQPATMAELVSRWISERQASTPLEPEWAMTCEWEIIQKAPELGFVFILSVLATTADEEILGSLSAGPLENLLAFYGASVIDKIEDEARRSPRFRALLRGVWQNKTPDEVWKRVLTASGEQR